MILIYGSDDGGVKSQNHDFNTAGRITGHRGVGLGVPLIERNWITYGQNIHAARL
jgi:hypothetical protein